MPEKQGNQTPERKPQTTRVNKALDETDNQPDQRASFWFILDLLWWI
tara:strand:- start:3172 stop:3312 length:141 start_codon:yes stop_codon:yes gene_type:complete